MIRGIYISEKGMVAQQRNQDVITNNLANLTTPAYKGEIAVFDTFADHLMERFNGGTGQPQREEIGISNLSGVQARVETNWRPGQATETGRNEDIALAGSGFFTLETLAGQRYTRIGSFQQDGNGYLVDGNGNYLLGEKGRLRVEGNWRVLPDGTLMVEDRVVDRLLVSDFPDLQQLIREEKGLWSAPAGVTSSQLQRPLVRQGFIEQANLDASAETVRMQMALLSYGANQQVIQAHDRLLDLAVNRIGSLR